MMRFTITVRNSAGRKVESYEAGTESEARAEAHAAMACAEPGWTADVDTETGARVVTYYSAD